MGLFIGLNDRKTGLACRNLAVNSGGVCRMFAENLPKEKAA